MFALRQPDKSKSKDSEGKHDLARLNQMGQGGENP